MTDPANPLGLNGFEFVEFTSPDPERMAAQLEQFGFVVASRHPTCDVVRYKQGRINLLLNRMAEGHAATFRSSPTVFAVTPMSGSASTRILPGKPPRAMWSASMLLGLYRMGAPSLPAAG